MAYSSSDFTEDVLNHLYDNELLGRRIIDADDLHQQKNAVIAAINKLLDASKQNAQVAAVEANAASAIAGSPATRFMDELLNEHETLTGIADNYNSRTLADCTYLLSAIYKGTSIEVHHPTESHILAIIEGLPSWAEWMTYVHEVDQ